MRINELIIENQQLDELNMAQVGQAIGKGATAAGKGIAATASGAVQAGKNFWQGMKQGWQAGKDAVASGGPDAAAAGGTTPAGATGGAAPQAGQQPQAGGAAPQAGQQPQAGGAAPQAGGAAPQAGGAAPQAGQQPQAGGATPTVGQINKAIPTLRTRDLQSVKKTVDTTIAKKGGAATGAGSNAGGAATGAGAPNLQVQQGGKKKKPAGQPGGVNLAPLPAGATLQAVEESIFYSKFLNMKI